MSFGNDSKPQRQVTTTQSNQSFPEELKPYISDILSRGQARFNEKDAAGYQPYTGARLAEFTDEMNQARTGLTGLATSGLSSDANLSSAKTYYDPALKFATRAGKEWNADTSQEYMSPYMQSVVDLEKREAERVGDVQAQQIGSAAVKSGGFGGSRQAIREAEQARNENQLQADIQTKGSQSAYESGLRAFQDQRNRDMQLGTTLQGMGTAAYNQAVTEQGQLAKVGEQEQAMNQRGLDLEYQKFLDESTAPDRALQDYSGLVRGYYMAPDTGTTSTVQKPAASLGTQLVGAATAGAGILGAFKGSKAGGLVGLADGGTVGLQTNNQVKNGNLLTLQEQLKRDADEKIDYINGVTLKQQQQQQQANTVKPATTKPVDISKAEVEKVKKKIVDDAAVTGTDPTPALTALNKALFDNKAKRIALAEQNQKDIKRDKWLELAKFGTNVMNAGSQGKGLLTAVGESGAASIEGLQDINKGERDFAAKQAAAEMGDLGISAKLESAKFEADRDYKLKLAELNADIAAAGGFDMKHLPTESDLSSIIADVGGNYLSNHPELNEKASAIGLAVMEDLHAGNLPYARATGIKTAVSKEIRRRMIEAGYAAGTAGAGGNNPTSKGKSNNAPPVSANPNATATLKSFIPKPKPNPKPNP
tara:strand:- start:554 stop:2500 length:1947 start_codon:yes stop_codon:yes gene_type:complete